MPLTRRLPHYTSTFAAFAMAALLGACGRGNETGNSTQVQMTDLEKADGTINDAMTDLDGVQVEGTMAAPIDNSANGSTAASVATEAKVQGSTSNASEEVVADQ